MKFKLSQVLSSEKEHKTNGFKVISDIYKTLQKSACFTGSARTYRVKNDGDDVLAPEYKHVEQDATALLETVGAYMKRLFELELAKDIANTTARASVIINGKTLIADAPATFLLFVEKQLRDLRAEIMKAPTLDPGETWAWDVNANRWFTATITAHRTRKEPRVVIKFEPTEHQPGQADVMHEDKIVGYFDLVKHSKALSPQRRKQLLDRVDQLAEAVKHARDEANAVDAFVRPLPELLDFVFAA